MSVLRPITDTVVKKTIELGQLLLSFGRVERITYHEDQVTPESDSTHTVMLGVMACAFAEEYVPQLDRGKIAQFALVHDLVEVYAGDTPTLGKLERDISKEEREHEALVRIKKEYDSVYPWVGKTIEEYESLQSSEARYVKLFDKILPKVVHILTKGVTVKKYGQTREALHEFHLSQMKKIRESYGADQEEALTLLAEVNEVVREVIF